MFCSFYKEHYEVVLILSYKEHYEVVLVMDIFIPEDHNPLRERDIRFNRK